MEEDPSPTRERLRAAGDGEAAEGDAGASTSRWARRMRAAAETCGVRARGEAAAAAGQGGRGAGAGLRFPGLRRRGRSRGSRGFTARRRIDQPGEKMNRLYAVENRYTITGGMADHRLRIPASQVGAFAVQLAAEIGDGHGRRDADSASADAGQDEGDGEFPGGLGRGTGEGSGGEPRTGAGAGRLAAACGGAPAGGGDQFGARRAGQYADRESRTVIEAGGEDRRTGEAISRTRRSRRFSSWAAIRSTTRRRIWSGRNCSRPCRMWSGSGYHEDETSQAGDVERAARRITWSIGATGGARTAPTSRCSR